MSYYPDMLILLSLAPLSLDPAYVCAAERSTPHRYDGGGGREADAGLAGDGLGGSVGPGRPGIKPSWGRRRELFQRLGHFKVISRDGVL